MDDPITDPVEILDTALSAATKAVSDQAIAAILGSVVSKKPSDLIAELEALRRQEEDKHGAA